MSRTIPGYDGLPLARRARVRLLSALAQLAASPVAHAAAVGARESALPSLRRRVQRSLAPLRLTAPSAARVDVAERPPLRAPPVGDALATVIIPTLGAKTLEQCLAAVAAYTCVPHEVVVVADGAPLDGRLTSHAAARLVLSRERRGFVGCANLGAAAARTATLVFLNDDAVVTPGWLGALLETLGEPRVGLAGPASNDSGDVATTSASYRSLSELCEHAARASGPSRAVDKLSLLCAAIPRALFERVGGLDEGYGWGGFEDDELCAALRRRGRTVALTPRAFVHHHGSMTFGALPTLERFARFEINRYRFERRHGRWRAP